MKILVACEESQIVTKEFRKRGHEAYSCDIIECSGGKPKWHIKDDVLKIINDDWDMMIAFPPCTHIAVSSAPWFEEKRKDGRQQEGIDFFMNIINAPIEKIAVENPIGIMSSIYRKPDQIIQPYYFGDREQKTTCLWLKNMPKLFHFKEDTLFDNKTHVGIDYIYSRAGKKHTRIHWIGGGRGKMRSKTFQGIAKAMGEQWS